MSHTLLGAIAQSNGMYMTVSGRQIIFSKTMDPVEWVYDGHTGALYPSGMPSFSVYPGSGIKFKNLVLASQDSGWAWDVVYLGGSGIKIQNRNNRAEGIDTEFGFNGASAVLSRSGGGKNLIITPPPSGEEEEREDPAPEASSWTWLWIILLLLVAAGVVFWLKKKGKL